MTTGGTNELRPADGRQAVARGAAIRPAATATKIVEPGSLAALLPDPFEGIGEITLAMIGGQRLLRDATASLLASEDELRVMGAFANVEALLGCETIGLPDVILLDCDELDHVAWRSAIGMLGASGYRECRIVMLCGEVSEEVIRCAIEQRVSGVILKSYSTEEIREAIVYIATGRTIMPAGWQRAFGRRGVKPLGLSPRHRQILALIAQGRGNEEIATELELSPNTVKFHVRVLYARLGVRNRVEAANRHVQMTRGGV